MTREQAKHKIDLLDFYLQNYVNDYGEESHTAMMMAIKALEQQTCTREDFIQYAKEHYGIDIEFKDSDKPDTFNELFGVEVCEDAVSRQAVLDIFADNADATRPYSIAWEKIRDLPPVNPQPKTGHWIGHREHCENLGVVPSGLGAYKWCSNCDCGIDVREWHRTNYNYCPNCGTKMVEPQESEVEE